MSKSKSTKKATAAKTRKPGKAAGPAKAATFARTLLAAAARNDETAVKTIMKAIQSEA